MKAVFRAAVILLIALQIVDACVTEHAIQHNSAAEWNPICAFLFSIFGTAMTLILVKMVGISLMAALLIDKVSLDSKKVTAVVVLVVVYVVVVWNNLLYL